MSGSLQQAETWPEVLSKDEEIIKKVEGFGSDWKWFDKSS